MCILKKKTINLCFLLIISITLCACTTKTSFSQNETYDSKTTETTEFIDYSTISEIQEIEQTELKNTYIKKEFDELGKVPIMMYHGIENIPSCETLYTGGNVDENGYNRTAEAFRNDLEFYYNSGYRMIRLADYVKGIIDCEAGFSPIILTFDDGYENNLKINKVNSDGSIEIDENCAIGILEEMKNKYPDFNVTATFFLTGKLFRNNNSSVAMNWLVQNGYDIGNHTKNHIDLTTRDENFAKIDVALQYETLDSIVGPENVVHIVALPLGKPNMFEDPRAYSIIDFFLGDKFYHTDSLMRVGWCPELSPFHKDINIFYLKRVRAYDNNGYEYDIESTFKDLEKNRYVSDGNVNTITIREKDKDKLGNTYNLQINTY